jgi:hypothetical protein
MNITRLRNLEARDEALVLNPAEEKAMAHRKSGENRQ